jgi:hypothetical protein
MKRPDRLTVLTWVAIAIAVAAVLAEGVALRDAGKRLRAQEAAEAAARRARARAAADSAAADSARATAASDTAASDTAAARAPGAPR